jgi:hypothetical protein
VPVDWREAWVYGYTQGKDRALVVRQPWLYVLLAGKLRRAQVICAGR